MTTINVYLKGGVEHEFTDTEAGKPLADYTAGCLYVIHGPTCTGYPIGNVLYWCVNADDVEVEA